MKLDGKNKEPFFFENENIELYAKFPWKNLGMNKNDRNLEPQKEPDHVIQKSD
jgi:hypothetical protein